MSSVFLSLLCFGCYIDELLVWFMLYAIAICRAPRSRNKGRVDAGGSSAIAIFSRWIGPLDAFSSVGSRGGGICAVGSKSDRKNLLLAPPPARFYCVLPVLRSLPCGSVRWWGSVVSDCGLVPARSPRRARRRGKDLVPPHVKSCPRRGCFGLFAL